MKGGAALPPLVEREPLQVAYARSRRVWRAATEAWLAAGRPDGFIVGGQRDGCRQPGACPARGPDLCRPCAAQEARAA